MATWLATARPSPPPDHPPALRRVSEGAPLLLADEEGSKIHGPPRLLGATGGRRAGPIAALACGALLVLGVVVRALGGAATPDGAAHRRAAFMLSLGAGMSTGVGASFVLCTSSINPALLAGTMAFSAGVMLYVSLVEVIGVANEHLATAHSASSAYALATLSFFVGVAVMAFVDGVVHRIFHASSWRQRGGSARLSRADERDAEQGRKPGGARGDEATELCGGDGADDADDADYDEAEAIRAVARIPAEQRERMLMMAAVVSAAIVLHNIPEGIATYVASYHSVSAGLPLAVAIAIHNLPEGLAIAMPVLYGTGSKAKAVALGTLSGFAEPFGALLASLVANENSSQSVFGGMFGATAGMMAYVCIEELLPTAYAEKGVSRSALTAAFFGGCAVMAASLVIEKYASAQE